MLISKRNARRSLIMTFLGLPLFLWIPQVHAAGLLRTIWACKAPCGTADGKQSFNGVSITYCATSVLSQEMISKLTPACQERNGRSDAVALRTSAGAVATCSSSGNVCETEGLVTASYSCSMLCPGDDKVVHKYTSCASSSTQAWTFASQVCKGAKPVPADWGARWDNCVPDGQTPCQ